MVNGGAVYSALNSDVAFNNNSLVCFIGNRAHNGAAIHSVEDSTIIFKGRTTILFILAMQAQKGVHVLFCKSPNLI